MRITYRTLAQLIEKMSDEQKDCDVTVEDGIENECYHAELRISAENHDSLDDNHPVIFIGNITNERVDDIDRLVDYVGI